MAAEAGDAFDKLKAGAKAVVKKVTDPKIRIAFITARDVRKRIYIEAD